MRFSTDTELSGHVSVQCEWTLIRRQSDICEEHITSIFRSRASKKPAGRRWGLYVPPKRRSLTELHSDKTQNVLCLLDVLLLTNAPR
jgi:hypothetical protein